LLGLFNPEDGSDVPPNYQLNSIGLDDVISENIVALITATARTSNPMTANPFTHINQHCMYLSALRR
jgi:hypothetical protein